MLPMNATYSCPFHDAENAATFSTRLPPRSRGKRNKEREAGKHREYGMNEASGTGSRRDKTSIPLTQPNRLSMNKRLVFTKATGTIRKNGHNPVPEPETASRSPRILPNIRYSGFCTPHLGRPGKRPWKNRKTGGKETDVPGARSPAFHPCRGVLPLPSGKAMIKKLPRLRMK